MRCILYIMKIPKKFLRSIILNDNLEFFDKKVGKWVKVKYDPCNTEHRIIKDIHYAEVEIECVREAMDLGVKMVTEWN